MINDMIINSLAVKYGLDAKVPSKIIIHDSNTTYIGIAKPGIEGTNVKGWQITKVWSDGVTTLISNCEGNLNFDYIIDNYATYNYKPT